MIAVFARPNHPKGYGYGETEHGYVIALVRCKSESQLASVKERLANEGLPEPFGHTWPWYGGRLDLLAVLPGNRVLGAKHTLLPVRPGNEKQSIGDNRYAGLYTAEELLA